MERQIALAASIIYEYEGRVSSSPFVEDFAFVFSCAATAELARNRISVACPNLNAEVFDSTLVFYPQNALPAKGHHKT